MEKQIVELDIKDIMPIALVLGVTGIVIAYTLQVQGDVQDDMTANSAEFNATGDSITAGSNLAAKLPLIATVLAAALIIGILLRNLAMR